MLTGRNPVDGEPLVGMRGVPSNGSVPGFDLTFSAPKSVSLLWGLGGPVAALEVKAAHREAVGAALSYMQREACWTRRGAGGSEFVQGNGYLAAGYVHRSSRNGDPQLHTHVLIANATKGPDGRWTRLYHPAIYDHAKTASYIYEAHLRHELTRRLGVEWQPTRKGIAEIAGFADEHLRAFSTRRAEILEAAGADASARSMQVAALATRKPKERDVGHGELLAGWRSRAEEIGLDREAIARTFDGEAPLRIDRTAPPVASEIQLGRAVTAAASHFDRREAIQAVADSLAEGAPGAEVERLADAFLASDSVIQIAEGAKGPRYTTRRIWELEREALAAAERMRAQGPDPAGELIAPRVIHVRPTLKTDQREMIRRLLTSPEGVAVVIGEAGTGKTFAIVAAAEGWAQAGIELRAAAPTWRAANVMRAEGLPASSIASLLLQLDRSEHDGGEGLPRGSVLLIDEAGMVDSAALARLVSHAERAQAKLVLVGDPEQLGEIEAGGLFRALAERGEPIYLDEVIRHRHDLDRDAAKRIREGEGREALTLYQSAERITVAPDAEARREAMIHDWHEAFERGEDAVMVAKRNADVRKLNELAREVRRQDGQLGTQEIEVGEAGFAAGDLVITRVNDPRAEIFNRERWRIAEVDAAERRAVLDGIDRPKRVEIGEDYLARTNPHSDAPALEHAYAVTTYSAQGTTVDRAFVMTDPSMDKQELYVAASRSREETFIYATPEIQAHREEIAPESSHLREGIPHIAEAAERDRAQLAAHDEALRAKFSGLPTEELVAPPRRAASCRRPRGESGEPAAQLAAADRARPRAYRGLQGRARGSAGATAPRAPRRAGPHRHLGGEVAQSDCATRSRDAGDARRGASRAPGAGRLRSGSRAAARAGDHRSADFPARLREERAGGEAERSGEAEGVGSRGVADRALPPRARDQRPEQGVWPRGETRGRAGTPAGRDATAARDSASPGPGAARGESAPTRQRIEHRPVNGRPPTYRH
jgi:conjugative relaxase-like TrwC/TraI family protein